MAKAYVAKLRSILRNLGTRVGAGKASVSTKSPTPVVTESPPEFEDRLETALVEQQKKWNFAWLNSPFALWAFSALALGFLSYCFNNYSSCISLQRTDNRQISKLFFEIYFRRDKINSLSHMEESLEALKAALKPLDPEQTYIFADFKEKKLTEVAFDLHTVISRWNLVSRSTTEGGGGERAEQSHSALPDFVERPRFDLSSEYWSSVYYRLVNSAIEHSPHDAFQEAQALIQTELGKDEKEKKAIDIVKKVKSAAGNLRNERDFARFLGPDDSGELISKCFGRTFWPNW